MQKTTTVKASARSTRLGYILLSAVLAAIYFWSTYLTLKAGANPLFPSIVLAAFSASLSRLASRYVHPKTAYRASAALSVGIGIAWWGIHIWVSVYSFQPGWPAALLAAGLLGSMAASWIDLGFCDETFIPTAETNARIALLYREAVPHPPPVPFSKRAFDILLSTLGILLSAPLVPLVGVSIWLQDPGPIIFIKHCAGLHGKHFRLYKLRTMKTNAETQTGPINAVDQDQRVLKGCRFLRHTALDELPQLFNILIGQMSFVGPRPLRSVVEIENIRQIPGYLRRYDALPGLAGLAQVCGSSQTPPRDKLRYERIYTRNASLLFDLKLIVVAFLVVFYLRWKKDWDGRIPRSWLRAGK